MTTARVVFELKYVVNKNLNRVKSESTVHLSYTAPLNVTMKLFVLCSIAVSVNVYSKVDFKLWHKQATEFSVETCKQIQHHWLLKE